MGITAAPSVKERFGNGGGQLAAAELTEKLGGAVGLHAAPAQNKPAGEAAGGLRETELTAGNGGVDSLDKLRAHAFPVTGVEDYLLVAADGGLGGKLAEQQHILVTGKLNEEPAGSLKAVGHHLLLEGEDGLKYIDEYSDPNTERGKKLRRSIADKFNFETLEFQTMQGLFDSIGLEPCKLCTYCWTGKE